MIAVQSPYEICPVIVGENLELRLVGIEDADDLLKCYSDPRAQLLFNSDNCTNRFEYATLEEMKNALAFWIAEYERRYYVRFAIIHQKSKHAIGTVEFFTKQIHDKATTIGVLRVDLQSSFESEDTLHELIHMIETDFRRYFAFTGIVTKAVKIAQARIKVFQSHGFVELTDKNIMNYDDYYIKSY